MKSDGACLVPFGAQNSRNLIEISVLHNENRMPRHTSHGKGLSSISTNNSASTLPSEVSKPSRFRDEKEDGIDNNNIKMYSNNYYILLMSDQPSSSASPEVDAFAQLVLDEESKDGRRLRKIVTNRGMSSGEYTRFVQELYLRRMLGVFDEQGNSVHTVKSGRTRVPGSHGSNK